MKSALIFSIISISILLASSAQAGWVPLTGEFVPISSIPTGGLEVGDKLFSGFEVTGLASGGPPTPSDVTVMVQGGQNDATGDYGLRIRLAWNAGADQLINAGLNYKVSILPGYDPYFITDATLWLATASAAGTGLVQASENIYDADFMGNSLLALAASAEDNDYGAFLMDSGDLMLRGNLAEFKEIFVRTGITVQGGSNGSAGLHEAFMLYSQVPEPATILMLGLGALALVRKRR
ncbi:MAG: PEP-CTERM sorting domain-containing protein [Planctomycetota bacterium]